MKTRTCSRHRRFPAPRQDLREDPCALMHDESEDIPCNEYVVVNEARMLPALQEHLLELGSLTLR